ncbi:hypothetical protein BT96DRAFT_949629 [Gymnopus androsaceus JB14]|uniref:Uncharacterized protein n=1 Tax=Gymnopus androsaceus JB14 TaxID=1447944 RepID=A0A6A4GKC4_9AGAR|nr:hypothetical protein BT96DRAFT_949629 [Gymnopus androsaceus JB14]
MNTSGRDNHFGGVKVFIMSLFMTDSDVSPKLPHTLPVLPRLHVALLNEAGTDQLFLSYFRYMVHPLRTQTNDLVGWYIQTAYVHIFISAEADEDSISDREDSSKEMELNISELDAGASWDAAFAANPGSKQEFIDGLQLGHELDKILAHYTQSHLQVDGPTSNMSPSYMMDKEEEENRRYEWNRFCSWVNVVTGQTAELFQYASTFANLPLQKGQEAKIVEQICQDIKNSKVNQDILQNACLAALPRGVYIQAHSMLLGNHILTSYLCMIDGFIYPNTPCTIHSGWNHESLYPATHYKVPFIADSTTLQFPKHQLVVG